VSSSQLLTTHSLQIERHRHYIDFITLTWTKQTYRGFVFTRQSLDHHLAGELTIVRLEQNLPNGELAKNRCGDCRRVYELFHARVRDEDDPLGFFTDIQASYLEGKRPNALLEEMVRGSWAAC
jgi:hypothetical protein